MQEFGFFLRHLDRYSRKQQLAIIERIAFDFYLRKGSVPAAVGILRRAASESPAGIKFNPWHDDLGRFTSGPSAAVTPVSDSEAPKSWGNPKTLTKHFNDHGGDFGTTSQQDYADQANQFLKRAQEEKLPGVQGSDGVMRFYDPASNTFGAYNPDGTTATFFKPKEGLVYFERQMATDSSEGRIINPLPEPPSSGGGSGGGFGGGIGKPGVLDNPWENIEE